MDVQEKVNQEQQTGGSLDPMGGHVFENLPSMPRFSRAMLSVKVMPLGQTSVHSNCVWQRQTPPRSSLRTLRRSCTAVSRGSSSRRKALLIAPGPRYAPLVLLPPQAAKQAPQVMQSRLVGVC